MKRILVPIERQAAANRCGAASLASVLRGFGLPGTQADIHAACQTGSTGICIDDLESAANERGLICDQLLVPVDHLLQQESKMIPAIVLTCSESVVPNCVVLWRRLFGVIQFLDPASGRRWQLERRFLDRVYIHTQLVSAMELTEWMRTPAFQLPLASRIKQLKISDPMTLIANAVCEPYWQGLASLDAVVRQATHQAKTVRIPNRSRRADLVSAWKKALCSPDTIPLQYWFANVPTDDVSTGSDAVAIQGAVVLRMRSRLSLKS